MSIIKYIWNVWLRRNLLIKETNDEINSKNRIEMKNFQCFLACLILMLSSYGLSAQNVINLNNNSTQSEAMTINNNMSLPEFLNDAKNYRSFSINPALQNQNTVAVGDTVILQLFEYAIYKSVVTNTVVDVNNILAITMKLPDYIYGYAIIVTSSENKSLVNVSIPEMEQSFCSRYDAASGEYYLIEIDKSKIDIHIDDIDYDIDEVEPKRIEDVNELDYLEIEEGEQLHREIEINAKQMDCGPSFNHSPNTNDTITLLVPYTQKAVNSTTTSTANGIGNVIAIMIAYSNLCMANSLTGIHFELAHSYLVSYVESDMTQSLADLSGTNDGYMDEVHATRKQYNADLVQLITDDAPPSGGTVGYGNMLSSSNMNGNYNRAFSVVDVDFTNGSTSVHEIGHNMGLGHGYNMISRSTGINAYSYGWDWVSNSTRYTSIMGYGGGTNYADGFARTVVPYFSDPTQQYLGTTIGHVSNADATRSLKELKHVVAFYSEKLKNIPDVPKNIVASTPTNTGATISWDTCANVDHYEIRYPVGGGTYYPYSTPDNRTYHTLTSSQNFSACRAYDIYIVAINECGDMVSSQTIKFKTKCTNSPTVTTQPANSITYNSATLNKNTTNIVNPITFDGFRYKEVSPDSAWKTSMSGVLTGLSPETEYKFYGWAATANDTVNGNVLRFTTTANPNPAIFTYITDTICQGNSYILKGKPYTTTGIHKDTFQTVNGDSIVELTLTVNPTHFIQISETICLGDGYDLNGTIYYSTGVYLDTLLTVNGGCDSIIELNLTVSSFLFTQISDDICQGDTIYFGGKPRTTSDIYYDTLLASFGCDSIIELTLTVKLTSYTSISASICAGDTYIFAGRKLTITDVYYDTLTNAIGCDSIVELTLTVNPSPNKPVISRDGNVIMSNISTGNQWYLNDTAILSATSNSYTCTKNGVYFVEVTNQNGCKSKSDRINITITTGITDIYSNNSRIRLYPNPTNAQLHLEFDGDEIQDYIIYNLTGQIVMNGKVGNKSIINVENLTQGIYYLKIMGVIAKIIIND